MYTATITLKKDNAHISIQISDICQKCIYRQDISNIRDVPNAILTVIDNFCEINSVKKEEIEIIEIKSSLEDSAITQRATRTISRVWRYTNKLTKA